MRLLLSLVVAALSSIALLAQTPPTGTDEDGVRKLIKAYVDAREQRDAKALAALVAPEADQLVSSGEWRKGREELVRGMLASSESSGGTRTITVQSVRFVVPDMAIADGRYEIAGTGASEARRMWTTFIVRKSAGSWRIEAIRNMLPAAAAR